MDSDRPGSTMLVCVLLALLTAAVYWPVARQGFINLDDPDYVSNPRVQAGLTAASVKWAFTSIHSSNWHPVTSLSHMLDCQLYGAKPAGHHLMNLLFHAANVVLLFGLLKRLTGAFWRSALVAALFALHPLHVESVAWVSERKDVLSGFFFLLTLWAYVEYAKAKGQRLKAKEAVSRQSSVVSSGKTADYGLQTTDHGLRAGPHVSRFTFHISILYLLSLFFFTLGLMSKPMLVTLPFVLLLLDYWPLRRPQLSPLAPRPSPLWPLLLEKLPFFALSAASCVVTFLVQRASGATVPLENAPIELRLANAVVAYARYLGKTFWPTKLAIFYPYARIDLDSWQAAGAALLLLAITVLAIAAALAGTRSSASRFRAKILGTRWKASLPEEGCPYLLVGWLWFVGMLVPVIGLVQVGKQALADRYTYLPHIGLFIAVVWGAAAVISGLKRPRLVSVVAGALALGACGMLTERQLSYWQKPLTLFQHAAAVTSRNFPVYTTVSSILADQGKLAEAIEWCRKALDISPNYGEALSTLGGIYAKEEKYDEAIANYRKAAEADPTYPEPRVALANLLIKQGEFAEAEGWCREALRVDPMNLPAMYSLGKALHSQGKLDAAADCYRRILAVAPKLFPPHRLLGNVLAAQGKADEAIAELLLALKIQPKDGDTRTVLGVELLNRGRIDEAAAQFTEAVRLQATNSLANYQLALIHQQRKQTRAAIECFRKALKAQPDWPETLNNLAWVLASSPDSTQRNGAEAVTLAERACQLTGFKEPLLVGTLAAAYAEAGRFPEAVSAAEKARALALAAGQKEIAQKNGELLGLYRAGQAYHERE